MTWGRVSCMAKMASFPVNLHDLASLQLKGTQAKYSGRRTPLEYPLLDWYGPFGSSLPSCW